MVLVARHPVPVGHVGGDHYLVTPPRNRNRVVGVGCRPPVERDRRGQDHPGVVQRLEVAGQAVRHVADHDHVVADYLVCRLPCRVVAPVVEPGVGEEVVLVAELEDVRPLNFVADHRGNQQRVVQLGHARVVFVVVQAQEPNRRVGPTCPRGHIRIGKDAEEVGDVVLGGVAVVNPVVDLVAPLVVVAPGGGFKDEVALAVVPLDHVGVTHGDVIGPLVGRPPLGVGLVLGAVTFKEDVVVAQLLDHHPVLIVQNQVNGGDLLVVGVVIGRVHRGVVELDRVVGVDNRRPRPLLKGGRFVVAKDRPGVLPAG